MEINDQIIQLYLAGLSGPDIAKRFKISSKKVYNILKGKRVEIRSKSEQVQVKFYASKKSYSWIKNPNFKQLLLETAGLMLYVGEGAKTGNTVDFTNSNQKVVSTFVDFLRYICQIDENRLKFYLYCFENQDKHQIIHFWCKLLNTTPTQFTKPYIRPKQTESKRIAEHGVIHVRYSDKRLLEEILEKIDVKLAHLKNDG